MNEKLKRGRIIFNGLQGGLSKTSSLLVLDKIISSTGKRILTFDLDTNNSITYSFSENGKGRVSK